MTTLATKEREKYTAAWNINAYRRMAPGEQFINLFLSIAEPPAESSLIDFGTGTGRAALALQKAGLSVFMLDIAENCLDEEVKKELGHNLLIANLWDEIDLPKVQFGFCTDVMEHIPPEHVDAVLANIAKLTDSAFFSICFAPDHFGKRLGESLHLTVKPFVWWRDKLRKLGELVDARDLIGEGIFYVKF